MPQSLKDSLRGCLEIPLFLRRGVDRFENSRAAFRQSCFVPLVAIPFSLPMALSDVELKGMPLLSILIIVIYRTVIGTFFFLGAVWVLSWPLERKDQFFRFGTIFNWLTISNTIIFWPLALLGLLGWAETVQYGIMLLLTVAFCISFLTFAIHHVLNLKWVAATGLALFSMACEVMAAKMLWG